MAQPPVLWDPGAQAERTALAWQRAGLGLLGVGAVLLHVNESGPGLLTMAVGLLDITTGAVLSTVVAPVRYRRTLLSLADNSSPLAHGSCLMTAVCTVASCLAASVGILQSL